MSNGQDQVPAGHNVLTLWANNGAIVTPELYAQRQAQLNHAKEMIARCEAQNYRGYQMFRDLEQQVAAGRQAEQVLSQWHTPAQPTTPVIHNAPPSMSLHHGGFVQATPPNGPPLWSDAQGAQVPGTSVPISYTSRNHFAPGNANSAQHRYLSEANQQPYHAHGAIPVVTAQPYTQTQFGNMPSDTSALPATDRAQTTHQVSNVSSLPQQQQPVNPYNPYMTGSGFVGIQPRNSGNNPGSDSLGRIPTPSGSHISHTNNSSYLASSTRSPEVHSTAGPSEAYPSPNTNLGGGTQAVSSDTFKQSRFESALVNHAITNDIMGFIKGLNGDAISEILRLVVVKLQEKLKYTGPIPVSRVLDLQTQTVVNDVVQYMVYKLQDLPQDAIINIIRKLKNDANSLLSNATRPLPSSSNAPTPQSQSSAASVAASLPSQPSASSASTSATPSFAPSPTIATAPALAPQVPSPNLTSAPRNTSGETSSQPRLTSNLTGQWIAPPEPSAPFASRDTDGAFRHYRHGTSPAFIALDNARVITPNHYRSAVARDPQIANVQPILPLSTPNTPSRPSQEGPARPASPWTPEKADKSRLARDILRSLGRPAGSPSVTSGHSPSPSDSLQGKRKRGSEADASEVADRKRRPQQPSRGFAQISEPVLASKDGQGNGAPDADTSNAGMDVPMDLSATDAEVYAEIKTPGALEMEQETEGPARGIFARATEPGFVASFDGPHIVSGIMTGHGQAEVPRAQSATHSMASEPPASKAPSSRSASPPPVDEIPAIAVKEPSSRASPALLADIGAQEGRGDPVRPPASKGLTSNPPASSSSVVSPSPITPLPRRNPDQLKSDIAHEPLFLPSPSSLRSAENSPYALRNGNNADVIELDEDVVSQDFVLDSSLLGGPRPEVPKVENQGQRRARSAQNEAWAGPSTSQSPGLNQPANAAAVKMSHVLMPPLPSWAKRINAFTKRAGKRRAVVVSSSDVDELDDDGEERLRQKVDEEKNAVSRSLRQLRETPCLWANCGAILQSAERLSKHLPMHAKEKSDRETFSCEWQECPRRFSNEANLARHLRSHAIATLFCAYEGCDQSFTRPGDLVRHQNRLQHRGDTLRPHETLIEPEVVPLPPMPPVLPSYMSIPRRITKHRMSNKVHVWLGSKVLASITCYSHPGGRSNAAVPSRASRRIAAKIAAIDQGAELEAAVDQTLRMGHDQYDPWIEDRSRKAPKYCEDLPATQVTHLVEEGLVCDPSCAEDGPKPVARPESKEPTDEHLLDENMGVISDGTQHVDHDGAVSGDNPDVSAAVGPPELTLVKTLEPSPSPSAAVPSIRQEGRGDEMDTSNWLNSLGEEVDVESLL